MKTEAGLDVGQVTASSYAAFRHASLALGKQYPAWEHLEPDTQEGWCSAVNDLAHDVEQSDGGTWRSVGGLLYRLVQSALECPEELALPYEDVIEGPAGLPWEAAVRHLVFLLDLEDGPGDLGPLEQNWYDWTLKRKTHASSSSETA